jgi:hypothetical protein
MVCASNGTIPWFEFQCYNVFRFTFKKVKQKLFIGGAQTFQTSRKDREPE